MWNRPKAKVGLFIKLLDEIHKFYQIDESYGASANNIGIIGV